jgi:exosortase
MLGIVLGVLLLALFWERLGELAACWQDDPNYSHGFLVPAVSAFLAYRVYQRQGTPRRGNGTAGLSWIVIGCLLHVGAVLVWWPPLDYLALVALLFGAAVAVGDREWARGFVFPIFFLFFMFPLPASLVDWLAVWLQDNVTGLATNVLDLLIPSTRQGNFIQVAGQAPVEVGEACSGLRQLVAFAALACILVHLAGRSLVYRLLLVLVAPLVAIVSNLLRVLLMCLIVRYWGGYWISGVYHDLWGLLTMLLGLGLYLALAWWLAKILGEETPSARKAAEDRLGHYARSSAAHQPGVPGAGPCPGYATDAGLGRRLAVIAVCLALALGGQAALLAHVHNGQLTPPPDIEPGTLSRVPVSLGAWTEANHLATLPPSSPAPPEAREQFRQTIAELTKLPPSNQSYFDRADDKSYRLYLATGENRDKALMAWLWMVHFKNGEDRNHHPAVCYRVAGKVEDPREHADLEVPGEKVQLQRFCFTGKSGRSYVYYWHYTLEPEAGPEVSALQKIYLKRLQRWPSITVEVFTNAQSPADLDKVAGFCQEVHCALRQQLPANSRLGSDILNIRLVEVDGR